MVGVVVKITKKGQATIPKKLREKFGFKDKAVVTESSEGISFKPLPYVSEEKGSLKRLFKNMEAKEIIEEARKEDTKKEKTLERV